jgi:predicted RNA-binding Zn ribbon-like protein
MITEFRHGAGRLCLDFLRTLRYRGAADATEELPDPAALAAWVRQFQPDLTAVTPTQAVVDDARALREAVYAMIQAARSDTACPDTARRRVNRAAAQPVPVPGLTPAGHLRWHSDDPVAATLSLIARDALDLGTSSATRVRDCADPRCGVLFLDNSRPGTRRWCSMDTCGNRAKKNTLRHKQ